MDRHSPDGELVAAAMAGSDAAFGHLVERHQQALRSFLRRTCGDHAAADELAQETFVTAWAALRRYRGGSSFRSWLCGIAYRRHLSSRRAAFRMLRRDGIYAAEQARVVNEGPELAIRIALDQALSELPMEQRAVLALCLGGSFSHAEAAEALDLPLGTVKSHVARGRAKLSERLGGGS